MIEAAHEVIRTGEPQLVRVDLTEDLLSLSPAVCGGTMEIFVGGHQRVTDEGPPLVHIHYLRPPDRERVYTQYLIYEEEGVKVTYAHNLNFESPKRIAGAVVLEAGSEAIWFTFPGAWHDIGIFHRADGSFTGTYANILDPVRLRRGRGLADYRSVPRSLDRSDRGPSDARRRRTGRSGGERMGRSGYRPARPGKRSGRCPRRQQPGSGPRRSSRNGPSPAPASLTF